MYKWLSDNISACTVTTNNVKFMYTQEINRD